MPLPNLDYTLIAAMDHNRVIGYKNQLPWHLPADLQHFKRLTLNKTILMGRRTYESIGRPLPRRRNVVITRDPSFRAEGCEVVTDCEALASIDSSIIVIGGAELYRQCLPQASALYLTLVQATFEGDTFFPEWDDGRWMEQSREAHQACEKNPYDYTFLHLTRDRSPG